MYVRYVQYKATVEAHGWIGIQTSGRGLLEDHPGGGRGPGAASRLSICEAGKVSLLHGTAIAGSVSTLEKFLTGNFGEGDLSLDSFCAGSRLFTAAHPCILKNGPLVSAVEALGVALEVLFSPHFAGVCDDLVEALTGHVRPLRLTDSGFLVHTIERAIIITEDRALAFPLSDITCPARCAAFIRTMLEETVQELTDVAKATVLEKQYTVKVALKKGRSGAQVPGVKDPEAGKAEVKMCGSHLGQLLGALKKNDTLIKCLKGGSCKFKHGKLGDITKKALRQAPEQLTFLSLVQLSPCTASQEPWPSPRL
jgi:hypothetical protein